MNLMYKSTRGDKKLLTASEAVIRGLADDGGLFVPVEFPKLSLPVSELVGKDYKEIAYFVLKEYFTDYSESELKECIEKAYDLKFDCKEIAPLSEHNGQYFLELFHGPTIAFKDMALSILPHLLTTALKKNDIKEKVVIMTATSGDTGKAALSAFADVEGTSIIVFYPKGGVSSIQERQMVTQKGANTKVVGVKGNFDDCQSGVKVMFNDSALKDKLKEKGYIFSSANSINIGRLFPQVAYYVYSYVKMVEMGAIKDGEPLNFAVPTGNFGNILAAYYAKMMGIPVGRLICASNDNKVLYDFFNSGCYDRKRDFILTTSPSMDILISSNLERLIYIISGCDEKKNSEYMNALLNKGEYTISPEEKEKLEGFEAGFATEDMVSNTIKEFYEKSGYVLDTHTAVAACVNLDYVRRSADTAKSVVVSTASPYKFVRSVLDAVGDKMSPDAGDFEMIDKLTEISGMQEPGAVKQIRSAQILHKDVCEVEKMQETVEKWLEINA